MTIDHLVRWVSDNTEGIRGWPSATEAALWFVARERAQDGWELSIKDRAHVLMNGQSAQTITEVEEWLFDFSDEEIIAKLRRHFGMDKE